MRQFIPYVFQVLSIILLLSISFQKNMTPSATSYYYIVPSTYSNITSLPSFLKPTLLPPFQEKPTLEKSSIVSHEEFYKLIAYSEGMILLLLIWYCSFYEFEKIKKVKTEKVIRRKRSRDNNELMEEDTISPKPLKFAKICKEHSFMAK